MVWTAGHRLQNGQYVIEAVLGRGYSGIVYKALHVPLDRLVAVKTPKSNPDSEKFVQRLLEEGRLLARLSRHPHPHMVGICDRFQEGEIHCLVMNFVPGETLSQRVKRQGALPEAEAVSCIQQIGNALVALHRLGLTHCDAQPNNIILRADSSSSHPTAVLIDFGIAKELIPNLRSATAKAGNRDFAPYEQLYQGIWEPTVDVYSLAASLYWAVTGERPAIARDRKLNDLPLVPPQQIVAGICDRTHRAILAGMELEPENRPPSMQAWLALLQTPVSTLS